MSLADKITNAELDVMRILWREQKSVRFADIRAELQDTTGREKSTINTLVRRLEEKGIISANKRTFKEYTANVTEADYLQTEEQNMLDKLYSGSAKKFVAALCERGELSEADIDELKDFFKMGGEDK